MNMETQSPVQLVRQLRCDTFFFPLELTSRSKNDMYRHGNLQPECPIIHERHGEEQRNLDDPPSKRDHSRLESWEPVTSALLGFALGWGKGELRGECLEGHVEELDESEKDA